jgi:hypothetical protein
MKYRYKIYPEHRMILESLSGEVTIQGILQKTRTLLEDPAYSKDFVGITDTRTGIARLTKVELYGFSDMLKQTKQEGTAPWAIIATDPILVALGQIYADRLATPSMIVVSTVEAAAKFIDRPMALDYFKD